MTTEIIVTIAAIILCGVGIAGCIVPAMPGPPLCLIAIFLIHYLVEPFSIATLIVLSVTTVIILAADYFLPIMIGKKFGATKQGIRGSLIGMFLGMFLTPIGMIAGLIIGSIIGDLIAQQSIKQAAIAAGGSLLGTLLTTGIKLIAAGLITLSVIIKLIGFYINK